MNEKLVRELMIIENQELIKRLAVYSHATWSSWMAYMFSLCAEVSGVAVIPAHLVDRWRRQMMTDYDKLPFDEKSSDDGEAEEMFNIFVDYVKNKNVELDQWTHTDIISRGDNDEIRTDKI